jgi:hypothetical protein
MKQASDENEWIGKSISLGGCGNTTVVRNYRL